MNPRWRFIIVLLIVVFAAAWCGSRVRAQEHARPRSGDRASPSQPGHRSQPSHAQPRQHDNRRDGGAQRSRPPQGRSDNRGDRAQRDDAQRRHPQPGYDNRGRGRYENGRDYSRYNWRNRQYQRWDRSRFPRHYYGPRMFDRYYRGRHFGPHYGLWYYDHFAWSLFYWPYPYEPLFGCGWYWVPLERQLYYDPYTGEEFWDYTDYQYRYICFD